MVPKPLLRIRLPFASYGRFVMVRSVMLAKLTVLLTPVNWVWLSALKASRRTSRRTRLPAGNDLESDMSRLLIAGAHRKKRADSAPSLGLVGGAKQFTLSICSEGSLLEPLPGSQVTFTRAPGLPSLPTRLVAPMPGIE